jgi:hypothetical protein
MSLDLTSALLTSEAGLFKNQTPKGTTFKAKPALKLALLGEAASAWLGGRVGSAAATLSACALPWAGARPQGANPDAGTNVGSPASLPSRVPQLVPTWLQVLSRTLYEACRLTRKEGLLSDTTVDELHVEAQLRAKPALLHSLEGSVDGASKVQNFSRDLNHHLALVFTHFQFGDRVEQMLGIIPKDMNRFVALTKDKPQPNAQDAQSWFKQLEKSPPMTEQRSQHQGTEHVNVGSQVDLF